MITLKEIKEYLLSGKHFKIVFFGDSITSTEWVHPNWREIIEYVIKFSLVDQMDDWKLPEWNIRAINSGYDGASQQDLLDRFDEAITKHEPDLVVFLEGAADIVWTMTIPQYLGLAKKFIERVRSNSRYFVFGGSIPTNKPELNLRIAPYIEELKKIFPIDRVKFINLFEELPKFDMSRFFTFANPYGNKLVGMKRGEIDWVHPNQLGNAYIAKVILEKGFGIKFDPEKYIRETNGGKMYPGF